MFRTAFGMAIFFTTDGHTKKGPIHEGRGQKGSFLLFFGFVQLTLPNW